MATKTIRIDDLDGSIITDESLKPLEVKVDGVTYKLDLSAANAVKFIDFLQGKAPLVNRDYSSTSTSNAGVTKLKKHGFETAEVRKWAIKEGKTGKNGLPINENTKILHQGIWDEYKATH